MDETDRYVPPPPPPPRPPPSRGAIVVGPPTRRPPDDDATHSPTSLSTRLRSDRDIAGGKRYPSMDRATRILVLITYRPSGSAGRFVTAAMRRGLLIIVGWRRSVVVFLPGRSSDEISRDPSPSPSSTSPSSSRSSSYSSCSSSPSSPS